MSTPAPSVPPRTGPVASFAPLAACLAAFLFYLRALRFGFVFDDRYQILDNAWIRSWHFLPGFFTHHVWMFNDPTVAGGNYWRPLFLTWLLFNHTLFGLNPIGWHLTSILAHVAVTWLVYRLALRLTADNTTAAVAALLFAVHPIHIEAVAWVSGMTDPLMALFFLASLLCWFRYRDLRRAGWLAASLLLYAGSMLSKEPGVVLPAMIAVAAWLLPQDASRTDAPGRAVPPLRRALRAAMPFAAVAALYLAGRYFVLRGIAHPLGNEPYTAMVLTWPGVLWFYARQLVFPVGLSGFYDLSVVEHLTVTNFAVPLLGLLLVAAALTMLARRSRQPLIAFCGWWMLITILPVLYIVLFPAWDIVHDRYLYLPSVGFVLLVAVAIRHGAPRLPDFGKRGNGNIDGASRLPAFGRRGNTIAAALVFVLFAAYCATGISDQGIWSDDFHLYRRGFAVAPDNAVPKLDLAIVLMQDRNDAPRATELFREALAKAPNLWEANYDLGFTYVLTNHNREAETYLSRAIAIRPHQAPQYSYRSVARFKLGDLDGAADDARRALELAPEGKRYHYAYGLILEQQGQLAAAAEQYRAELQIYPDDQIVKDSLARVEKAIRR